jgi:Protein of unknown function (DUF1236)
MGSTHHNNCLKIPRRDRFPQGTNAGAMHWLAEFHASHGELLMCTRIVVIAALAAAIGAPIAAQAQTVGVVPGPGVAVTESGGITVDQRPAFREYVVRERVPNYTIPDRVVVGGVLPETGVTYYDVPQTFGATPYRYTVINGSTVLVEPRTRRIVQVIE